jgi:hypothetical protein
MPKDRMARAIGRLEARIELKYDTSSSKKVSKSKAPKPLKKLGTKGKASVTDIYDPNLSQSEYERLREKQLRRARR